jgi:hypothetical protein
MFFSPCSNSCHFLHVTHTTTETLYIQPFDARAQTPAHRLISQYTYATHTYIHCQVQTLYMQAPQRRDSNKISCPALYKISCPDLDAKWMAKVPYADGWSSTHVLASHELPTEQQEHGGQVENIFRMNFSCGCGHTTTSCLISVSQRLVPKQKCVCSLYSKKECNFNILVYISNHFKLNYTTPETAITTGSKPAFVARFFLSGSGQSTVIEIWPFTTCCSPDSDTNFHKTKKEKEKRNTGRVRLDPCANREREGWTHHTSIHPHHREGENKSQIESRSIPISGGHRRSRDENGRNFPRTVPFRFLHFSVRFRICEIPFSYLRK